ncbi:1-acyl-sn-glycerol-3-phosphate acyltransferase [Alphaproteobacteria bacterium]|nr:1-acyl-sn-glycerol-3-phosphate acyltransferase [Alphaproteobacteria bacterium]
MSRTLFNTPILSSVLRGIGFICLKLINWRVVNHLPEMPPKAIVIVAPHTSNWDFPLFLLTVLALRINLNVLIKHTLFFFPVGLFLRYCGGIPVDRRAPGARVNNTSATFKKGENMLLLITPEGTRSPRTHWKSGFYRMAEAAEVPIIIAYVDVKNRVSGLHHIVTPKGDFEGDMDKIYRFYDDKTGVIPTNYASPNKPAPGDQ